MLVKGCDNGKVEGCGSQHVGNQSCCLDFLLGCFETLVDLYLAFCVGCLKYWKKVTAEDLKCGAYIPPHIA